MLLEMESIEFEVVGDFNSERMRLFSAVFFCFLILKSKNGRAIFEFPAMRNLPPTQDDGCAVHAVACRVRGRLLITTTLTFATMERRTR